MQLSNKSYVLRAEKFFCELFTCSIKLFIFIAKGVICAFINVLIDMSIPCMVTVYAKPGFNNNHIQ